MPTPQFKKTVIEDSQALVNVYAGAVKIESKGTHFKRIRFRIVEKPAAAAPGVLFVFKKLTVQVQAETFASLINVPEVQAWFLSCGKQLLADAIASENEPTQVLQD